MKIAGWTCLYDETRRLEIYSTNISIDSTHEMKVLIVPVYIRFS